MTQHPSSGTASLEVVVEPPEGITIILDGARVASTSPYRAASVEAGNHSLQVRGMGYHPITLPVTVRSGEHLRVPVSLRARPPATYEDGAEPQAPEPSPGSDTAAAVEPAPARAPEAAAPPSGPAAHIVGPELPEGVAPVDVHILAQPSAPIYVDGRSTDGRMVRLRRSRGTVQVGALILTYEINPGRAMRILVPNDEAVWFKDTQQVKGSSVIKLNRGAMRMRRVATGSDQ
ncbi:MAG TPA: PEGA domain-containing protein, partial [Myxococcota bacterium]|nr:PEGA domain-containing protein [Myxococcota bacterium]